MRVVKKQVVKLLIASGVALSTSQVIAGTTTVTFDDAGLQHGTVINTQYNASLGVSVSAENLDNNVDLAVTYDTSPNNPANAGLNRGQYDPDLEGPQWGNNNLSRYGIDASRHTTGNVLIIQENNTGCGDGTCDLPDDEGSRPSGTITFNFSNPLSNLGFDLIDFENVEQRNSSVTFFNDAMEQATVMFSSFEASQDAVFGNNSLNRIWLSSLGVANVTAAQFYFGGSGAVDNVTFSLSTSTSVPEPGVLALLALGGIGLFSRRRVR